jgi:NAD+ diphosphatase
MLSTLSYSGGSLDRASALRKDPRWLEAQLSNPNSLIIPFWRGQIGVHCFTDHALDHQPLFIPVKDFDSTPLEAELTVFLGQENQQSIFAMDFSSLEEKDFPFIKEDIQLQDLRQAVHRLAPSHAAMLGFAKAVLHWHKNHQYCGKCGTKSCSQFGGHMRLCQNTACASEHFPRTDPAVIMLVTGTCQSNGQALCLLGSHSQFANKLYSTLAGFVDPGESLEEAVKREVLEEAGIKTHNVTYQGSQPWPFPSQIMLGFRAQALEQTIQIDHDELLDARWFSAEEIRSAGNWGDEQAELWLPRHDSIARHLVDQWLTEQP